MNEPIRPLFEFTMVSLLTVFCIILSFLQHVRGFPNNFHNSAKQPPIHQSQHSIPKALHTRGGGGGGKIPLDPQLMAALNVFDLNRERIRLKKSLEKSVLVKKFIRHIKDICTMNNNTQHKR